MPCWSPASRSRSRRESSATGWASTILPMSSCNCTRSTNAGRRPGRPGLACTPEARRAGDRPPSRGWIRRGFLARTAPGAGRACRPARRSPPAPGSGRFGDLVGRDGFVGRSGHDESTSGTIAASGSGVARGMAWLSSIGKSSDMLATSWTMGSHRLESDRKPAGPKLRSRPDDLEPHLVLCSLLLHVD